MGVPETVAAAREALPEWAALPTPTRLDRLQAVRRSIADDPHAWAEATTRPERSLAQVLAAEVGPLADAVRWLDQHGAKTLATRRGEGDRFGWLKPGSLALRVERKPLGVVLVIGAGNYPLFLLAAPAAQALAAGNAALLQPPHRSCTRCSLRAASSRGAARCATARSKRRSGRSIRASITSSLPGRRRRAERSPAEQRRRSRPARLSAPAATRSSYSPERT